MKERPGDQPLPTPNDSRDIQSMVIDDIGKRRSVGIERYGTALQPFNGRSSLRDAYEEALDLCMYLKQRLVEEDLVDNVVAQNVRLLKENARLAYQVTELESHKGEHVEYVDRNGDERPFRRPAIVTDNSG